MKIEEIRIPAPWGHIAAKLWGDPADKAIIAAHGIQDNAGTFDRLIPTLPHHFYYICVDLPGHGFSTSLHETTPLYYHNILLAYKIVVDYFKRPKYILMGHSFGGTLSVFFAQMYPDIISKLIVLDGSYTLPVSPKFYMTMLQNVYTFYCKNLENKVENVRSYGYKEIIEMIMKNRYDGKLTFEAAEDVAKRMIKPVGNGRYSFATNIRLKHIIFPSATEEYNIQLLKLNPVRCPALILITSNSHFTIYNKKLLEYYRETGFCVKVIDSHHHVHQTNPELVEPDVTRFLNTDCSKL